MKRAILFAAVATCTFSLNARSGVAETKTPVSRAPRAIAIEVLILSTKGRTEDEHTVQLSGPTDEVAAHLRELESKGQIVDIDRIRLTTLENQKVLVQAGRATPVASGRSLGGRGGPAQMSYHHQDVGTLISATARVDGDAIVVELQVEKSQLERHAGKPQADDELVPLGTETLTSQVTVRIGSGKTVLASGLEKRADAESSGQLVLASARLLDTSSDAKGVAPENRTEERQIRIFSLQSTAAEDAAAVIKQLCDDGSGQIRVSADSRANSLIISAEKERQLDVIEAILLRLDEIDPQGARQAAQLEIYSLDELDPQSVLLVLQTMLAGRPEIRMDVDPKTGNLIVLASPNDHTTVRATLEKLRRKPALAEPDQAQKERDEKRKPGKTGDRPTPLIIYLRHAQAEQVAKVVQEVYQGTRTEMSITVDPRLNAIIVVAPAALYQEVTKLAEVLDRTVTKPPSPEASDDPKSGVQEETRRRQRTFGDVLATVQWTTVTDGFVLRVYSGQEVTQINQRHDAYENRRREYLAKRMPLDERRGSIGRQLPDQRLLAYGQAMLKRYDRDSDGVLDAKEQEGMRSGTGDMDANKDGSITSREMTRYFVQQMRERTNPSPSVQSVPDNWEELQDELDAIDAKIEALRGEFEDVLEPQAEHDFYKVMEVTREFIRVRHGQEERIIPFASIREIRRTMHE